MKDKGKRLYPHDERMLRVRCNDLPKVFCDPDSAAHKTDARNSNRNINESFSNTGKRGVADLTT
jgi:hypothetical protein